MDSKLRKLENLNRVLKPPQELGGNFVPVGFEPQFNFMFLAEMPSMREPEDPEELHTNYNFKRDKRLHKIMIECGVAGSYITDIVKERGEPGRPTEEQITKWLPFLLKEIEIIKPSFIIIVGEGNYRRNFKPFIESKIPGGVKMDWIFHYCTQVQTSKLEQKFKEVIARMRNGE